MKSQNNGIENAESCFNHGNKLLAQGKLDDAIVSFKKALEIKPDIAEAHYNIGNILLSQGKLDAASVSYRKALDICPTFAEAYFNLGNTLSGLGRIDDALSSYQKCLAIKPDFAAVYNNLGALFLEQLRFDDAFACYKKALDLKPDQFETIINLAVYCEKHNDLDKAEYFVLKALKLQPDHHHAILVHAIIYRRRGLMKEAIQILQYYLTEDNHFTKEYNFELAKLYDLTHEYEKAFKHLLVANDIYRKKLEVRNINKEVYLNKIEQLHKMAKPSWLQSLVSNVDHEAHQNPCFLVGFNRSGTTLLGQILDSHPNVQVLDEKDTLKIVELSIEDYPSGLSRLSEKDIQKLRTLYFTKADQYITKNTHSVLIDKLPLNLLHIPLIQLLFPGAKIILALRHPCDVVLSNFMQDFIINNANANFLCIEDAANLYDLSMGLWDTYTENIPMDLHVVKYESLVENFTGEVKNLLAFLGLEWNDSVLEFNRNAQNKVINTASYQSVNEPIYQRAKYRWLHYKKQLKPVLHKLEPYITKFNYSE